MNYYLRVEAVNLHTVLSDTSQLSVIRSSSLLLRQATETLSSILLKDNHELVITPIATGSFDGALFL